ncbi:hypothetical protein LTR10_019858 [Elasticomyces elasticus]|uniref:Zn(2)-C6 fungal-type domain-containing protein n=1 Tax=Exophiala sideris TaxID=1016849 RepID=A0ABR0IXN7_9EURO|nr:hypothetical protein LTR10_019858 [Elasticomyces elasticus]KAK5022418.1 hypothetical protein LTS07_010078 [Exophiala sideris]KAK5027224.1 hypothetical protein LTR13_009619 [Exophiala sideris]KAK5051272.1 hypothetical protein LTR69_010298 [Exophiala sideris]KAK5177764.1 hypothetical protein LTR44_009739 [Eurotiomycetes sp. CCFEE 6388]
MLMQPTYTRPSTGVEKAAATDEPKIMLAAEIDSLDGSGTTSKANRQKKFHHKSFTGCATCTGALSLNQCSPKAGRGLIDATEVTLTPRFSECSDLIPQPRARRIKCTEERPQCSRCITHGTVCPGYVNRVWTFESGKSSGTSAIDRRAETLVDLTWNEAADQQRDNPTTLFWRRPYNRPRFKSDLELPSGAIPRGDGLHKADSPAIWNRAIPRIANERTELRPAPSSIKVIPRGMSEPESDSFMMRSFQYFRENSIPSFLYVNPSPSACHVFRCLIPQAYFTEPALKHSIIAVATAQESMANLEDGARLAARGLIEYSKALKILGDTSSQPTTLVMLLACLQCVAFETFQNAPKNASLHLQNGLRVLRQWKRSRRVDKRTLTGDDNIIGMYLEPVFAHIETVFVRSAVEPMGDAAGDLTYNPPVSPEKFQSLLEARAKMFEIWMYFLSTHTPDSINTQEQLLILPMWQDWYAKLLLCMRDMPKWPMRQQINARILRLQYDASISALLCQRVRGEMVWDEELDKYKSMLAECVDICHTPGTFQSVRDPNDMNFAIIPGILPPLWLIGMTCRDQATRRRALELLHEHHRRCGHVDDCSAAVLVETISHLEEEGLPPTATKCSDIPESRRIRALESDLTEAGKFVLTFARAPHYTTRETIEVPYKSTTALPKCKYRLWPIVASMNLIGYQGLIRPHALSCVCKAYGQ